MFIDIHWKFVFDAIKLYCKIIKFGIYKGISNVLIFYIEEREAMSHLTNIISMSTVQLQRPVFPIQSPQVNILEFICIFNQAVHSLSISVINSINMVKIAT